MESVAEIDYDGIKAEIDKGKAVCHLMSGFSEEDLDASAVRIIGFQMFDYFDKIEKNLKIEN